MFGRCNSIAPFLTVLCAGVGLRAQCTTQFDLNQVVQTVQSSNPSGGGNFGSNLYGPGGTTISSFARIGNTWFFAAETMATGRELWKTDGTTAGTVFVKDINPGPQDSNPVNMLACNGTLFFTCDDGTHGRELWKSDGSEAGTVLVKDILSGSYHGSPSRLECMNGIVYFGASWSLSGYWGLWRSDGTEAGTVEILDTSGFHVPAPEHMRRNSNNTELYFSAIVGQTGRRLWKSNGTTAQVIPLTPGLNIVSPRYFHNINGRTVFRAQAVQFGAHGDEVCVTDGTTAGTFLLQDINPGFGSSNPAMEFETTIGNEYFFSCYDGSSQQIWRTNGTTAGTYAVTSFPLNPYIQNLIASGNTLYFTAQDGTYGRELWKFTGGSASLVRDIWPGLSGSNPENLTPWGSNGVAFRCVQLGNGVELWTSNGTSGGTVMAGEIRPGPQSSYPEWITSLNGNQVICAANDSVHGKELWTSNGITSSLLKDVDPVSTTQGSNPSAVTSIDGNRLLFAANDGVNGTEVWQIAGGSASMLADIESGAGASNPQDFTNCWLGTQNLTFFRATTTAAGEELWVTNGTSAGTMMLKDIHPGSNGSSITDLTCSGDLLFFCADDGTNGKELWASNGTAAGTQMIADINPGPASGIGAAGYLASCLGFVVFAADNGVNGTEPWFSNGTTAGTAMIVDIEPGALGSNPRQWTCIGPRVVFSATTSSLGEEPWRTDGTAAGTTPLIDIAFLSTSSAPYGFTKCGDAVFFSAWNAAVGAELWKTDGTPGGTMFVADIYSGAQGSQINWLACCNGTLFFTANNGSNGTELWTSDGTGAGTSMVLDINPGFASSSPNNLACTGDRLYFSATTANEGNELWRTDGSAAGTALFCDLVIGTDGSAPQHITPSNGKLYFVANDNVSGDELHVVVEDLAVAEMLGVGCGMSQPTMRASEPLLGGNVQLEGEGTPFGHIGVIAFGAPAPTPWPTPITGSCPVWIDLFQPFATMPTLVFTPTWTDTLAIPATPSLAGSQVALQVMYLDVATVFPFLTSNGVLLTAGS